MKNIVDDILTVEKELTKRNIGILLSASDRILNSYFYVSSLIKEFPEYTSKLYALRGEKLRDNKELLYLVFPQLCRSGAMDCLDTSIKNDFEWMIKGMQFNPFIYNFLPLKIKNDLKFNLELLHIIPKFLGLEISQEILTNPVFLTATVKNYDKNQFKDFVIDKIIDYPQLKEELSRIYTNSTTQEEFQKYMLKYFWEELLKEKKSGDLVIDKKIKI